MNKKMTLRQMKQLIEINDSGKGIGEAVQELIRRLTDGGVAGKSDDILVIQAKSFWDKGFGRELECDKFENYLGTIPKIPEHLLANDPDFPMLVLIEPRLGLNKACQLIGIKFNGNDSTLAPFNGRYTDPKEPKWVRMQNGIRNRNRTPFDCRRELKDNELAATALSGICAFLHYPDCIKRDEHFMDLSGSVHAEDPGSLCLPRVLVW